MTDVDAVYPATLDAVADVSLASAEETTFGYTFFRKNGDNAGDIITKDNRIIPVPAIVRVDGKDLLVKDWASPGSPNEKLTDPVSLPSASTSMGRWSPNGVYYAVLTDAAPYLIIYKRTGYTMTKLADPAVLPSTYGGDLAWSPDSQYLITGMVNDSPYLNWYKRSGDVFTKLATPVEIPEGFVKTVDWCSDGEHIALGLDSHPYLNLYKRVNDSLIKIESPSLPPNGALNRVRWSPDGALLAAENTQGFYLYALSNQTLVKQPNAPVFGSIIRDLEWSPDGKYLLVVEDFYPFLNFFKREGNNLVKLEDSYLMATLPLAGLLSSCAWSPDGRYVYFCDLNSPYSYIVRFKEGSLQLTDGLSPSPMMSSVDWSPDGKILATTLDTSPYVAFYKSAMGPIPGIATRVFQE